MARYDTTGLEVDGFRWISTLAFPCKAVGKALCSSSALEAQRLCEVVTSSRQAQMTFCQQFQHPFSACFRQNLFHHCCLLQHKSAERSLPFGFTLEIFDILIFSSFQLTSEIDFLGPSRVHGPSRMGKFVGRQDVAASAQEIHNAIIPTIVGQF